MSKSREKIGVQFYPMTAEEIKQWYRDKLLTTAGYLLAIKKITKLPGSNLVIPNVLKFCREWEISKSAFYRAVNELRQKGYTDWEATHGIILKETQKVVAFPSEEKEETEEKYPTDGTVSHKRNEVSHERDSVSHERDDVSHERDSVSHERENCSPKPAPDNNSSTPHIYTDNIQTLSESERESFLEFGKKKASQLPKPPQLPVKWIQTHHEELYSEWRAQIKNQKSIYKFEVYQEYQHQMWYEKLQSVVKTFVELGNDTGLRRFFLDDFHRCWFDWAKSARDDVRELLVNNPIMQEWNYG
ncbi:MAG: hypothetical protein HC815_27605 [Richelia sp. RM1_1_1]|nr:hypothetical protein [Richelia sp. RM1_1_1]